MNYGEKCNTAGRASTDGWASRPYHSGCDGPGGIAAWVRLRQGFRRRTSCYGGQVGASLLREDATKARQRCCAQLGAHIRFCETNPPFFERIFGVSDYEYICCEGNMRGKSVGSFWKTNPKSGGFGGFGCHIWVRFQKANPTLPHMAGGMTCTTYGQFFELFYAFPGALLSNWRVFSCRAR